MVTGPEIPTARFISILQAKGCLLIHTISSVDWYCLSGIQSLLRFFECAHIHLTIDSLGYFQALRFSMIDTFANYVLYFTSSPSPFSISLRLASGWLKPPGSPYFITTRK